MRVAILFDEIKPQDVLDDRDVLQQVKTVVESLKRLGHSYTLVPCTLNLTEMKSHLQSIRPDICFNLLDTLDSQDCLSHLPIAVLDANGIKHTGPTSYAIALSTRKVFAKSLMRAAGIPTPRMIDANTALQEVNSKWIVKGSNEDGSFSMTDDSVIRGTTGEVQSKIIKCQLSTGRQFFAEQYIDGREFTVPFLCGKILPVMEVTYTDYPDDKPKILAQAAKWQPDSFEAKHTGEYFPTDILLLSELVDIASRCVELFSLRGWGRIDFRCDSQNRLYVIDVNANSCLAPDAWWAGSLKHAGIDFDKAIQRILDEK